MQKISATDERKMSIYSLLFVNLFSKNMTAIKTGKSKNRTFNNNVSIKLNFLPMTLIAQSNPYVCVNPPKIVHYFPMQDVTYFHYISIKLNTHPLKNVYHSYTVDEYLYDPYSTVTPLHYDRCPAHRHHLPVLQSSCQTTLHRQQKALYTSKESSRFPLK